VVDFAYSGKRQNIFNDITVEHARWMGERLAQLSDDQIRDAFRAANYSAAEIETLAKAVRARINELAAL
jgi:ribonuclease I